MQTTQVTAAEADGRGAVRQTSRDMLSILSTGESKGACAALQRARGQAATGLWGCSGRAGADFASLSHQFGEGGHTMTMSG